MKIVHVEPTPSPHSMKLTLDEKLNPGVRMSYTKEQAAEAPQFLRKLLDIPGVSGVFHTADFIAIDREPKADWESILTAAREILGIAEGQTGGLRTAVGESAKEETAGFGEVRVLVQTLRGIPMQVRVLSGLEERRAALSERFLKAATEASMASPNLIRERKLEERGIRYGDLDEVLQEVVRELEAAFDQTRLNELVAASLSGAAAAPGTVSDAAASGAMRQTPESLDAWLSNQDWRKRYAALERLTPTMETLPLLAKALQDDQMSIRRLAVVYLGDIKEPDSLPYLLRAMNDPSPIVRRTAGDTLSDRGDPAAIPAMIHALQDSSKLVRWRAARFLYETGDETALVALRNAKDDPEFEVRLQIRLAIERIESGEEAQGTVWQQMTRRSREDGTEA